MLREIRIYMPHIVDAEQVAALKDNRPFLMKANVPIGASFLGVVAIPSIVDMMGFSGGGGPPAYAFAVNPDEHETEKYLFAAVMPNKVLPAIATGMLQYTPLGVQQSVGILFGHFRLTGPAVDDGAVEDTISEDGFVVDMIVYEPPPVLAAAYNPKMQSTLGGG